MSVPSARRAQRARVALLEATGSDSFVRAVFRLMLATVPGDYVYTLFQCSPQPRWGAFRTSNGLTMSGELMQLICEECPAIPIIMANPGIKVLPSRCDLPPEEELVQTPFYKLFMKPYGFRHGLALFCWRSVSPPVLDCVFSLIRNEGREDFSDAEVAQIEALHPEVDRARRRVVAREEESAALHSLQHLLRDLPVPALVLNWDLAPLYHNREGVESCALWEQGAEARMLKPEFALPRDFLATCSAMKEEYQALWASPGFSRDACKRQLRSIRTPALEATISLLQFESALLGDPNFLIVFKTSLADALPPQPFAALMNLTTQERKVANLAAEGKANTEIAAILGRSVGTVKAELHAVFKKTGVTSRAQLVRKLMGA